MENKIKGDRKMRKNEKGLTLLETLVAMVILGMVVLTANSFLIGFVNANKSIKNISQATQIGDKVMERIRKTSYESITGEIDTLDSEFHCQWNVSEDTISNMKVISLTVAWPLNSLNHEIQLSTIIAQ